ncbi:hypothetical protein D3C71_1917670 [compost metagenome]
MVSAIGHRDQAFGAHLTGHDADVGLAFANGTDDVVGQAFAQVDIHIRVLAQVGAQHGWQKLAQRRGVGKHTHMALDAAGVFLHVAAQVLDLAEHGAGMLHKGLSG